MGATVSISDGKLIIIKLEINHECQADQGTSFEYANKT